MIGGEQKWPPCQDADVTPLRGQLLTTDSDTHRQQQKKKINKSGKQRQITIMRPVPPVWRVGTETTVRRVAKLAWMSNAGRDAPSATRCTWRRGGAASRVDRKSMPVGPSMTLTELLSPVQQLRDEDKIKLISDVDVASLQDWKDT